MTRGASGFGSFLYDLSQRTPRRVYVGCVVVLAVLGGIAYVVTHDAKRDGDRALHRARSVSALTVLAPAGWSASRALPDCVGQEWEAQCAVAPLQSAWTSPTSDRSRRAAAEDACRDLAAALAPYLADGSVAPVEECVSASLDLAPGRPVTDAAPLLRWSDENADWVVRATTMTRTGTGPDDVVVNDDPRRFVFEVTATPR